MSSKLTSMEFLGELTEALWACETDGEWKLKGFKEGRVLLVGNGGSYAVASHIANDLNKAGYPALVPDPATLSCFANDYGWYLAFSEWVRRHITRHDLLVCISSSGESNNIIYAAAEAGPQRTVTLSGFSPHNRLRRMGHINYYVPSSNYGIVEICHLAILHSIVNPGSR